MEYVLKGKRNDQSSTVESCICDFVTMDKSQCVGDLEMIVAPILKVVVIPVTIFMHRQNQVSLSVVQPLI